MPGDGTKPPSPAKPLSPAKSPPDGAPMPELFDTKKPRDAMQGATSAAGSVVKGFVGGAAALVGAPIVGAREGGVGGFFKGLGVSGKRAL